MKHSAWIFNLALVTLILAACNISQTALSPTTAPPTTTPVRSTVTSPSHVATQSLPTQERYPTAALIPLPASLQIDEKIDVPYTASQELLDVFSPVQAGSWPVVIVLHGGGDIKENVRNLARAIAGLGSVVFAPNYDTEKGPAGAFEDVACATRFGRANASQYGGKDERVIVVGHSLGGMVGALMMFAGDEFNGDCLTPQGSALPDAEVSLDGLFDPIPYIPAEKCQSEPDACLKIDPFTYVSRKPIRSEVRFMLLVGEYTPAHQNAQAFRDALQAAGYDVSLAQIPGLDHNEMEMPQLETLSVIMRLLHPSAP